MFIGLACLTALVAIVSLWSKAKEPRYGGHRLSYWLHQLPATFCYRGSMTGNACLGVDRWGRTFRVEREKAYVSVAAIRAIGTNGLPFLIRKLGSRRLPLILRLEDWAFGRGIGLPFLADPDMERAQAVTGLLALGPMPAGALDQLQKLRSDSRGRILDSVGWVLAAQTNNNLRPVGVWLHGSNMVASPQSENGGASRR